MILSKLKWALADGWVVAQRNLTHVRHVPEKLLDVNADLIAFQEVWSRNALLACFEKAGLLTKYQIVARDAAPGLVQVAAAIRNKYRILNDPAKHWIEDFPPEAKLVKRPPASGEPLNTMKLEITQFSRPVLPQLVSASPRRRPST